MSRKVLKKLKQSWAFIIGSLLISGSVLGGCAGDGGHSSSVGQTTSAHAQAPEAQSKTTDKAQKQTQSPLADQTKATPDSNEEKE